jgi:2-keto-myo-inositol isomerase
MNPLALHTWTLDTTPLPDALAIAKRTGWKGVELRRLDFTRAADAGHSADVVIGQVRASGLGVACVGVEFGWMWAADEERHRLLSVFADQCARAAALGCDLVMSPVDKGRGGLTQAATSVREVGDIAAEHGVRVAIEFNSQCEQLNALAPMREVLARAGHPRCGLLLDTYHIGRSGCTMAELEDVAPAEITYVQYSDVPHGALTPGQVLNRLPPGRGIVPFREFFALMRAKHYSGYFSYEAPNTEAWKRDAAEVAAEAVAATRAVA